MTDALDDTLGIPRKSRKQFDIVTIAPVDESTGIVDDAKVHNTNARDLAFMAVQEMLNLAQQSQHPKAYEVLNSLIKTYAEISTNLVDIEIKKQRIEKNNRIEESGDTPTTVNQNLFITTSDLLKMIEDNKK